MNRSVAQIHLVSSSMTRSALPAAIPAAFRPYRPRVAGTSRFIPIRELRCHLREWGDTGKPVVLLLHGWMDTACSFQFLIDAIEPAVRKRFHWIAPDWRGFGRSQWAADGVYAFPDYFADLDALVRVLSPRRALHIVGHSLGANIGAWYAAARPERVRAVVNIEGFGLRARSADAAPAYLRTWLDDLARTPARRPYATLAAVIERVTELAPHVDPACAAFVAASWSERLRGGGYQLRADPRHRRTTQPLFRLDEARAMWRAVQAPVLWIEARETKNLARHGISRAALARRRGAIANLTRVVIARAGHMVHWERPLELAAAIGPFLLRHRAHPPGRAPAALDTRVGVGSNAG